MSDTTSGPADQRDDMESGPPPAEKVASAESTAKPTSESHGADSDVGLGPVSARGHVNHSTVDAAVSARAAADTPPHPVPTIEPEAVISSEDEVAAAVARSTGERTATVVGDAVVDTPSPVQTANPAIVASAGAKSAPSAATVGYAAHSADTNGAPDPHVTVAPVTAALEPQLVAPLFLQRPQPPTYRSNRGLGILIALVGTLAFALLWAVAVVAVGAMLTPSNDFVPSLVQFFTSRLAGWAPVVAFFVGMVVLIQIINRARWWGYILGGLFVAIFVYLVYIGAVLVDNQFFSRNLGEQQLLLRQAWVAPFAVLAGVIAREVSIWTGAWLAARGRALKASNAEAKADYEQQLVDAQNQAANAYAQQRYGA